MKLKNIHTVLFIALILTSCAPARAAVSSTETAAPMSTATPIPLATAITPTLTPENLMPTDEPTSPLSAEGPWLVYRHNALFLGYADLSGKPEEFIIMNQDGVGRMSITLPDCDDKVNSFLMGGENSANYMAKIGGDVYIFRPPEATGLLVYRRQLWFSNCQTFFRGDKKGGGLLVSFYQATKDISPELILYELPDGKIRERFPLVRCSKDTDVCEKFRSNWPQMMEQQPQWSPNGRYLAFVAVLDASSSDLFVYDTQTDNLRRLTDGPDWVGPIQWSPDGTQIIMQELLSDSYFFFAPLSTPATSVWSVSVNTNDIQLLYSTDNARIEQHILFWLGDKHFFTYEGRLVNADQAHNLRFVDMEAGTDRILFDGEFMMIDFDPIHQTFVLYEIDTPKYPQGIYLVSLKTGDIHRLPPHIFDLPEWDENTGLFVSDIACEKDPDSLQAFDYQGNFKCVPQPTPTPRPLEPVRYPAPNGKWSVSVEDEDGLWLESEGKPAVPISHETASDVIWCPDSSCFFYTVLQQDHHWNLYRVSLPDLTVKLVDEEIETQGTYQWLGDEK